MEFEPDLGLFRLPVQDDALPEPADLGGGRFARRAAVKRAFWEPMRHDEALQPTELPGVSSDLVSEERIEELLDPGVVGEPQDVRRPWEVEEALEECAPQLCLRNLERYEMDAWVDDLWWIVRDVRETPDDVAATLDPIHRADLGERELHFLEELSGPIVRAFRDEHQDLVARTEWRAFTWRRGPRGADDYVGEPES